MNLPDARLHVYSLTNNNSNRRRGRNNCATCAATTAAAARQVRIYYNTEDNSSNSNELRLGGMCSSYIVVRVVVCSSFEEKTNIGMFCVGAVWMRSS